MHSKLLKIFGVSLTCPLNCMLNYIKWTTDDCLTLAQELITDLKTLYELQYNHTLIYAGSERLKKIGMFILSFIKM